MKNAQKKEHHEHQKALKPLLKHLHEDEIKLKKKGSDMAHKKHHEHHEKAQQKKVSSHKAHSNMALKAKVASKGHSRKK